MSRVIAQLRYVLATYLLLDHTQCFLPVDVIPGHDGLELLLGIDN